MKTELASKVALAYAPDLAGVTEFMTGHSADWAIAHHRLHPHLKFGLHWEELSDAVSEKMAQADGEEWDGQPNFQVQHVFTHDDEFAYDASGKHPMPYCDWDDMQEDADIKDVQATCVLEEEYASRAEGMLNDHDPINHVGPVRIDC